MGAHSGSLSVAFGQADGLIALWDPRQSNKASRETTLATTTVKAFRSHTAVVADIRWSPVSPFHLASCDYAGLVKVWDTRSTIPLHTLSSHDNKKAFCLDWFSVSGTTEQCQVAGGGEDKKVSLQFVRVGAS